MYIYLCICIHMYMTKIKSIFCKSYKYPFFQMLLNVYMYIQKFELKFLQIVNIGLISNY